MKTKLSNALAYLSHFEPARLRALWVAAVALLGGLGISVTPAIDARVSLSIGAVIALVAGVQGEWTRSRVFSPATVDELADRIKDLQAALSATGQPPGTGGTGGAADPRPVDGYDTLRDSWPR